MNSVAINKLMLSFAKPVFQRLADGRWHNFVTHEAQAGVVPFGEWFREVVGLSILLAYRFAESDDTWARLTPKGKEAMMVYLRDSEAAHA
jgi:hypothetical protein